MTLLRYGNTNTYFLNGLLIDTDLPGTLYGLYREMKRNGLRREELKYVLATHYHPDHAGLIGELTENGVTLLLIDRQTEHVRFPEHIFARQKGSAYRPIRVSDAVVISCSESRAFLRGIGIGGEIVPTDSHSPDGIALITDGGECFAGDLEPMQYIAAYGEDSPLKTDWDRILRLHPVTAHFGHCNDQDLTGKTLS